MRKYAGWLSFVIFVAVVVAGLSMGEFRTLLANAVTICLNCIGIG